MPHDGTDSGGTRDGRTKGAKDGSPGLGIDTDARRLQAIQLRRQNFTYEVIAKALGCSRTHAFRLVNDGWGDLIDTTNEERRILRAIETENLDRILAVLVPLATADDLVEEREETINGVQITIKAEATITRLKIVDRIIKVGKRYADLHGLDIPVAKEDVGGGQKALVPLEELVRRVREHDTQRMAN